MARPEAHIGCRVGMVYPSTRASMGTARTSALQVAETSSDSSWDRAPQVLGALLTPVTAATILRHAERGYMRKLCDLLSELRETWPHLAAELGKRRDAVTGMRWVVRPAKVQGKRGQKRAARNADFVAGRLDSARGDETLLPFGAIHGHLLDAVYFGRSAVETVFRRDSQGSWAIRGFSPIEPKRISYAGSDRPHLYDEAGNSANPKLSTLPGVDLREAFPNKIVLHEPRIVGSEMATRQGIGRVLVWALMFVKWTGRAWMQFAELFANPWRWVEFAKGSDTNDITFAKNVLLNMSGYSVAAYPAGTRPNFFEARNTTVHGDLAAFWNAEISKVVVGGTILSSVGNTGGNRALGEVMERGFEQIYIGDAVAEAFSVTRDLVKSLVRLEFGEEDAESYCPEFAWVTERPQDLDKRRQRADAFIDRGGRLAQKDYLDTFVGLPVPDENAEIMQPISAVKADAEAEAGADEEAETEPSDSEGDTEDVDESGAAAVGDGNDSED